MEPKCSGEGGIAVIYEPLSHHPPLYPLSNVIAGLHLQQVALGPFQHPSAAGARRKHAG